MRGHARAFVQPESGAQVLKIESNGAVRLLILDRAQRRNALTPEISGALLAGLNAAMADPATRAIVIAAEGPAFCAGLDLEFARTGSAAEMKQLVDYQQEIGRVILFGRKPVIAAVHGHAVGGGFEMALVCDAVVWGEGAQGWFPEVSKGLVVTGGTSAILPLVVGLARAKSMLLFGARWSGAQLHAAGLVHSVTASANVRAQAIALAEYLAAQPADGIAFAKRALLLGAQATIEAALALETRGALAGPGPALQDER